MADGTLWFDTAVDTKGFNKASDEVAKTTEATSGAAKKQMGGIGDLISSLGPKLGEIGAKIGSSLAGAGMKALVVVAAIVAVIAAIAALAVSFVKMGKVVYDTLESWVNQMWSTMARSQAIKAGVDHIKDAFDGVKQATIAAFMPLVQFALPYIMMVTAFLVKLFNLIGMIIAALFRQSKALQYIAGSTKSATQAATQALAAWDQLNVLQQPGAEPNAGAGQFAWVDTAPLEESWRKLKALILDTIINPLILAWNKLTEGLREAFQGVWLQIVDFAKARWEDLLGTISDITGIDIETLRGYIEEFVAGFLNSFSKALTDPVGAIEDAWENTKLLAGFAAQAIQDAWSYAMNYIAQTVGLAVYNLNKKWEEIKLTAKLAVDSILQAWDPFVKTIQTKVIDPFKKAWNSALDSLKLAFSGFASSTLSGIVGLINGIISAINSMIRSVVSGINSLVSAANAAMAWLPGWKPLSTISAPNIPYIQMPKLAGGAVIPPNSRFAAILGDQSSGRNLEAPEGLIRQIIQEEVGMVKAEVSINFSGSLGALVEQLKPYVDNENIRIGPSLVRRSA